MKWFVAVALFPLVALAQKPPAGCPLLTPAEIGAATGMKVGQSHETNMVVPSGQGKPSLPMSGCMWRLGDQGMVNLSVMRASGSKEDRDKGLAKIRQTYDVLRSRGWTITESNFAGTMCNTATPPKAESEQAPAMSGCFAITKGYVYSVGVMGPHFKIPAEKVKLLADDLAKRLP